MSLATMIPLVGPAIALALLPSATLAMMVASAEALQGRFPTPAVLLVAYTFLGIEEIGVEIEDPFGEDENDLALDAMTRNLEIELRESDRKSVV